MTPRQTSGTLYVMTIFEVLVFMTRCVLCPVLGSGKDLKRQTLLELVDYVNNPGGQKIFTEALMPDIMAMVVSGRCAFTSIHLVGSTLIPLCLVCEHLSCAPAPDGRL
jgi:hypothetical protein